MTETTRTYTLTLCANLPKDENGLTSYTRTGVPDHQLPHAINAACDLGPGVDHVKVRPEGRPQPRLMPAVETGHREYDQADK